MPIQRVEIETRPEFPDALAGQVEQRLRQWLGLTVGRVRRRKVFHLDLGLSEAEAQTVLEALVDPVSEQGAIGMLPDAFGGDAPLFLSIAFRPGVTDSVGASAKRAAEDRLGRSLEGHAYASTLYLVWGLTPDRLQEAARQLLYNPLIEQARLDEHPRTLDCSVPRAGASTAPVVRDVPLRSLDDEALLELSRRGMLALDLVEMRAVAEHFRSLGRDPTDAELECIAQTWSEHCKHKIFAAPIEMEHEDGAIERIDRGLFRTFIRGATEAVAAERERRGLDAPGAAFLVSVFHDNAGVVRFTAEDHLVYKVETHNSPSALDPYGGAMTGIVGVNRDSFGTGLGADLLTNVWGYCFGDPRYTGSLPPGLMHPRRLRDGVHQGVVDGGNQSGIPYSRGFELFDDRYLGKPLVFCGTVAVMPAERAGRLTHVKTIHVGDHLIMLGGRIGKDGIHGATFSSVELNEDSPVQAVQIGDPITQKMMFDMLAEARDAGLMSGMTDNGAGGLSSSVGEMAEATGGVRIDLARAPLKYPGLEPWEILISEAQERMTVAVPPEHLDAFLALAKRREVEASVLGEFMDDGRLVVTYGEQTVVDLALSFLHEGLPRQTLRARLSPRQTPPVDAARRLEWSGAPRLLALWEGLMARPNLASHQHRARRYDHEVKGLSVVKPLLGRRRDVPSTATVMRVRHGRPEGVVLAEGIHPFVSDVDARGMAEVAVDESVRRLLCAGARYDRMAALDNFCWPDPVYSSRTPDGHHKLAQLVECCRGLRAACEAFGLPLISGKDSMKNDAHLHGVKISIPPTLLVSAMGQLASVDRALTLVPRAEGDQLWLLGPSLGGLGGSEILRMLEVQGGEFPRLPLDELAGLYRSFVALRDEGFVRSAHVVGRGGLAAALGHLVLASDRGFTIDLTPWADDPVGGLFGEAGGRILMTARPEAAAAIERRIPAALRVSLGTVGAFEGHGHITVRMRDADLFTVPGEALRRAFETGLADL